MQDGPAQNEAFWFDMDYIILCEDMTYSISCCKQITCRHMLSLLRSSNLPYVTWSLHVLHTSEFMHDYNTIYVLLSKSIS